MFSNAWKANQPTMPAATIVPNSVGRLAGDPAAAPQDDAEQDQDQPGAEEASSSPATVKTKSVCCSGTNWPLVCGAVEEALAEQSAGADRDPGLVGVVARPGGVERAGWRRREAVDLVLLQQVQVHDHDRAERRHHQHADDPACWTRRHIASTPNTTNATTMRVADVGLQQDQQRSAPPRPRA